jgi:hypothetical protein
MTQRKGTTESYDQQKENYTMTQRKSTTKKLWSAERKLHNDEKKLDKKANNDPHRKNTQKTI